MGGAISFNVLVAVVPLFLFAVGIAGQLLTARFPDPGSVVIGFLEQSIPAVQGDVDLLGLIRTQVERMLARDDDFTIVGAVLLIWLSTRLVGTLRTVLREVFDVGRSRDLVRGKLFDVQMVVVGGLLFMGNIWITAGIRAARDFGLDLLALQDVSASMVQRWTAHLVAFLSIWVLFLGIYRYLPARRIPWKAALIAASFTAVVHEILIRGFGWYVTQVANYGTTYGNLISLAVLFFWIYYEALGFILGGEVAQVWTMRRARRVHLSEIHGTADQGM
jgi:membrane protein